MYHFVYRTTNTINGKIYIGKHSTEDLDDGYIGSGTVFKRAVSKYGKENFSFEMLHMCSTEDEAYEIESKLVTEEFVALKTNYNRMVGGRHSISTVCTGLKFYNNGTENRRYHPDLVPSGWTPGRMNMNQNRNKSSLARNRKQSETMKGKVPTINTRTAVCPHCGKEGQEANMKRWHFDKCKHKAKDDG